MVLDILKSEMDAHAESCTLIDLNYKFYPTEISGVVKVKITDKGREISPAIAYRLARLIETKLRNDHERILESELMPNNVVYTVEQVVYTVEQFEDLP